MERFVAPVSNVVTLLAVCVIAIAAGARVRRLRNMPSVMQLIGSCSILIGTAFSAYVRGALVRGRLGQKLPASQAQLYNTLWFLGTIVITVGFIAFAWGYVASEAESLPDRRQSTTKDESA